MLVSFFFLLRQGGLKVSITEFLTLLELLQKRVIRFDIEQFYYLSRACLVKDESLYDRFDRVFSAHFKGVRDLFGPDGADIPEGIRIGQEGSRHRRAVKVWDKREFRNLDDSLELGTRNLKVALRRCSAGNTRLLSRYCHS